MDQITFGPFRLDVASNRLTRDGEKLELRPQALHALRTLLEHAGQHVDYDVMIREAWDGNVVSRHTVAVTVGEVKKALQEYGGWIGYRPKLGYRLEVPESEDLIRKGWHFWNRQTKEGLEKAVCCFERAAQADGADFRAYEGIAAAYMKLGAYSMCAPSHAYARFREAYKHATALGRVTPELRADKALGLHVFERKLAEAEAELLAIRRERPHASKILVTLLMLYITMGRFDDAAKVLVETQDAQHLFPTLPATEVLLRICQRQFQMAVAFGKQAVELHPFLHLSRMFYAQALECAGDFETALEQYRLASVMFSGSMLQALEGRCLAKLRRVDEARKILQSLETIRSNEYVDAYHMALLHEALGRRDEAFQELARAAEENSATICFMDVDPKMDSLRSDPRFRKVRERVFVCGSSAPQAARRTALV